MGVIHGVDLDERLQRARELYSLGYRALAIGGVAGRASSHRRHIKQAFMSGTFYVERGGGLARFRAARPGEPVTAPDRWVRV